MGNKGEKKEIFNRLREHVQAFSWKTLPNFRVVFFVVLTFTQPPGVWGWDSLFLGIKVVTRLRGNPTSAFAFFVKENRRSDQTSKSVYKAKG